MPGTASKVPLTLSRACMSPQSPTSQGRFPPVSGFSVDDDPEGHPPIDTAWLGPAAVENKQQTDDMASSLHRNESWASGNKQKAIFALKNKAGTVPVCALRPAGTLQTCHVIPSGLLWATNTILEEFLLHMKAHTVCNFESVVFGVFFLGLCCFALLCSILFFSDTLNLNAILFLHVSIQHFFLCCLWTASCWLNQMMLIQSAHVPLHFLGSQILAGDLCN